MARFCTSCGTELPEGAAFCTECGAKAPQPVSAPQPAAVPEPSAPAPQAAPPQTVPQPREQGGEQSGNAEPAPRSSEPQTVYPAPPQKEKKTVSTIGFMLLQLLYAIPIVGFFASLVLSIAPENRTVRRHALANFLWRIILLGLLIFGAFRARPAIEEAWRKVEPAIVNGEGEGIDSLNELLNSLTGGDS